MFRSIGVRARERSQWTSEPGNPDVRHRGGVPWDVAPVPYRWHACRTQTGELRREGGVLDGTCCCACGAVTDRAGAWRHRNCRRHRDSAGLCCDPDTPQPVRARVAAGISPHPGARRRPRSTRAGVA
ncbi:MAG: hypothetical protein ACRDUV_12400 [Pseudonocardiaceae bacterium]